MTVNPLLDSNTPTIVLPTPFFMEIAFNWNDGDHKKAVQLLIGSGELTPENKNALQLLIDSDAFSSVDHEVKVTDLLSMVKP